MDNTTRPPDRVKDSDRAYYNTRLTRVVLPAPAKFPEQTGYSIRRCMSGRAARGALHRGGCRSWLMQRNPHGETPTTDEFTAKITKALKEGTTPWQKPWKPGERSSPRNFSTEREYRGGNAVYLAVEGTGKGYADPRWGGYRQIAAGGGHVRKGEKGRRLMVRRVQVKDAR